MEENIKREGSTVYERTVIEDIAFVTHIYFHVRMENVQVDYLKM